MICIAKQSEESDSLGVAISDYSFFEAVFRLFPPNTEDSRCRITDVESHPVKAWWKKREKVLCTLPPPPSPNINFITMLISMMQEQHQQIASHSASSLALITSCDAILSQGITYQRFQLVTASFQCCFFFQRILPIH